MKRHLIISLLALVSVSALALGCSSDNPASPSDIPAKNSFAQPNPTENQRWLWGQWEIYVDIENEKIEAVPLRTADLHFNVVPLLKEGTLNQNIAFSNLLVDPTNRLLQVDISLTHPFPNLKHVPGFDVKGILYTRGDGYLLDASNAFISNFKEPRLTNADGYTRWWNPGEFPTPGLFGYKDGFYGTKHNNSTFKINISGYKYFADALKATDSVNLINQNNRGVFRAGSTNTRRYHIDFKHQTGTFLVFNYAVDACWEPIPGYQPGIDPVPNIPADFPLTANSPEPYLIRFNESSNTLAATTLGGTSGQLNFSVDIFDWQALDVLSTVPMEVSVVQVEIPQFGIGPLDLVPVNGSGDGSNMSTYTGSFSGTSPDKLEYVDVIVTATSSEGDYQTAVTHFTKNNPLQAFFLYEAKVKDNDTYSGWTRRYTRSLWPEFPNQGANPADIAVYKKGGKTYAATIDQLNPDPNKEGGHAPDSVNEWGDDYQSYSLPEHYHFPLDPLSNSGLWNDINRITVSDASTRLFFTSTNQLDEFTSPDDDPLYCYLNWVTHTYLGNAKAEYWNGVYWSDGAPRFYATDPSNGLTGANDYIYAVFLYDATGQGPGNPGADPQRYIAMRWAPPYEPKTSDIKWQRPFNVPPNGTDTGFVDRSQPWIHRLGVDDSMTNPRFYILDSKREIEVVDMNWSLDEFSGSFPIGTVTNANLPTGALSMVDLEVLNTKPMGTTRNHVAALCTAPNNKWRVWVFDYDSSQPIDSQGVTVWLSEEFDGEPLSLDALDSPVEVHVLHKIGGFTHVTVFRLYP